MSGCRDCERCTRSLVSKLGHAALAVGTGGLSLLPAAAAAPFKRSCPTCKHPLTDHEGVKVQIANLVAQQAQPVQQQVIVVQVTTASQAQPGPARCRCEHCGATFAESPRCPECGARAIPIASEPASAPPPPITISTIPAVAMAPAATTVAGPVPWHQQTLFVVLGLVFLAPLGIVLLWRNKLWTERTRVIVSVASTALFLVALVSSNSK